MKKIEDSFGGLKANKEIREPSRPKIIYSNFLIHLQKEKFDQIRIKLSFPTFGIKEVERKRIPFLGLLRFIVGGSASSRLFKILRLDNDLVYSVTSQTLFYPFMGDFSIRFSTSKDKLLMSLYLMKRELEKVNKMGITKRELERAKNLYRRNVVSFNFETPYQIASWVVNEELGHKQILLPEDYMEMVESASIEDINRLAKDVFNFSKLNIGLMGNLDDKDVRKIEHIFRQ
jgi:predicted Zn-dependent peptidase